MNNAKVLLDYKGDAPINVRAMFVLDGKINLTIGTVFFSGPPNSVDRVCTLLDDKGWLYTLPLNTQYIEL